MVFLFEDKSNNIYLMFLNRIIRYAYHPMIKFPQKGPALSGNKIKLANIDALNLAIQEEL